MSRLASGGRSLEAGSRRLRAVATGAIAVMAAASMAVGLAGCGETQGDAQGSGIAHDAVVVYSQDTTVDGQSYESTAADQNAILVTDGDVVLGNIAVTRDSDDSTGGDQASFYGVGVAILAEGGQTAIGNATITTDAKGGAGVFAYGDGVVEISDSTIETTQDTSGGIHVAGGGELRAQNVSATTRGGSSAAIRSDRGGGLMVVEGGDYASYGTGSPAIYCTATIAAKDAKLAAHGSEAICIEGLNSLYLYDCDLSGAMPDLDQNDCTWNVILYQSMSGDAQVGNSTFQMTGGTLTAQNGGMFYTTNTQSTFILEDVDIAYADDAGFFLRCTGNQNQRGWGQAGANGADCTFTAIDQKMQGDIVWDSISQLDFYMTGGSTLTGAFVQDEGCAGSGGDGGAVLTIDAGSRWIVTGDSVLTTLHNAGSIVDAQGNGVTVRDASGTVLVAGTSPYSITVGAYDTNADVSLAGSITAYEDAQVNNGSQQAGQPDGEAGSGAPGGGTGGAPDGGTPPEPPSGDAGGGTGGAPGGTPPEPPDGDTGGNGSAPEPPGGAGGAPAARNES